MRKTAQTLWTNRNLTQRTVRLSRSVAWYTTEPLYCTGATVFTRYNVSSTKDYTTQTKYNHLYNTMEEKEHTEDVAYTNKLELNRDNFESLLKRRFFIAPAFSIYGGKVYFTIFIFFFAFHRPLHNRCEGFI